MKRVRVRKMIGFWFVFADGRYHSAWPSWIAAYAAARQVARLR